MFNLIISLSVTTHSFYHHHNSAIWSSQHMIMYNIKYLLTTKTL